MIRDSIRKSMELIRNDNEFIKWISNINLSFGDVVIFNNSFVYRLNLKTTKNSRYIGLNIDGTTLNFNNLIILEGITLISDFKHIMKAGKNNLNILSIDEVIEEETKKLGNLVFILLGEIMDNVQISQVINHGSFDYLILNPLLENDVEINERNIYINNTTDEEVIWENIKSILTINGQQNLIDDNLRDRIGESLDIVEKNAYASLLIPTNTSTENSIIASIVQRLRNQIDDYKIALDTFIPNKKNLYDSSTEILRIAYNFASDATTLIRLIVSICDLKPLVLWGTLGQHYKLSEAFKSLPRLRSTNKQVLKNYIDTIGNARNSKFHDLFPFNKTLNVLLPDSSLEKVSLRIFSAYKAKNQNQLIYQDKELVEVLTEFTRSGERIVPRNFWEKNLDVMCATVDLFEATGDFLSILLKMKEK